MVVEMKKVSWVRDNSFILEDISWKVRKQEHWAIVGLNGSGKTTLLNMINGYIWPSRGEITVLGQKFGSCDLRELRKKIGWVSSSLQEKLYGNEKVEDIVVSGKFATIGLYDQPTKETMERAHNLMGQLGFLSFYKRQYHSLSQGEKQKVLIARALMSNPELLILDEPCTGLDIFAREKLLRSIEEISGKTSAPTLLYVSHHIEEILPIFNHTLLLQKGKVHSAGKTREILNSEKLSDFFQTGIKIEWQKERAWAQIF